MWSETSVHERRHICPEQTSQTVSSRRAGFCFICMQLACITEQQEVQGGNGRWRRRGTRRMCPQPSCRVSNILFLSDRERANKHWPPGSLSPSHPRCPRWGVQTDMNKRSYKRKVLLRGRWGDVPRAQFIVWMHPPHTPSYRITYYRGWCVQFLWVGGHGFLSAARKTMRSFMTFNSNFCNVVLQKEPWMNKCLLLCLCYKVETKCIEINQFWTSWRKSKVARP